MANTPEVQRAIRQSHVRQALRRAATRRHEAEAARAKTMTDVAKLAREGIDLGIPILVIARDADLSRPSIYALLDERP